MSFQFAVLNFGSKISDPKTSLQDESDQGQIRKLVNGQFFRARRTLKIIFDRRQNFEKL